MDANRGLKKSDIFLNINESTNKSYIQISKGNFILRRKRIPQSTA